MSRASMNTEAWHGKIIGLKGGPKARVVAKRENNREVPMNWSASTTNITIDSNAEDVGATQDAPPLAANQADDTGMQEE